MQQLTCNIDLSSSFYYLFFSFVLIELKPFVLEGKVLGDKILKKCEKVRKILVSVKFFVRNSGPGNGCANFMGAWKTCVLSAGKAHVHKIPPFRGGGVWGGASPPSGIFNKNHPSSPPGASDCRFPSPKQRKKNPESPPRRCFKDPAVVFYRRRSLMLPHRSESL